MIRAVLDVNVLLSAIIAPLGYSHRLVSGWEASQFTNVTAKMIKNSTQATADA